MEATYLQKIWHPTRNFPLSFSKLPINSNKKVWWLGECGHEWEATVYGMHKLQIEPCPYCGNRKVLEGFNDLKTNYPHIAAQWNYEKNMIKVENVLSSTQQKFWWVCDKNHEWETRLHLRTKTNSDCPYCSGAKTLTGFNDLATLHPKIAQEWHPTKNLHLTPFTVSAGSKKKVWWVCGEGHEWETNIHNRTRKNGSGCPYCTGQKIIVGVNDFATLSPENTNFWHPTRNTLTPKELGIYSKTKVWWKEKCGHEYQLSPQSRHKALKCQVCVNRIVVPGFNDLNTTYPDIAAEWHPTRNSDVTVESVTSGQPKKFWWKCAKNHEWEASVNDRTRYQTKCPYCTNQKVLQGFNDLATTHTKLRHEWDLNLNTIKPFQVTAGSDLRVWWKCDKNHSWQAYIYSRTNKNQANGCPVCSQKKVWPGETDLQTLNPEIAKQWHPTRNTLTPKEVSLYSSVSVWWMCEQKHEWFTTVAARSQGKGCKKCASAKQSSEGEKEIVNYLTKFTNLGSIHTNDRTVLQGKELDIYVPEKKLAVEFNGLYWHSEAAGKTKTYHYDKWLACKNQGIQLIQIWEDDWERNPELVKQMLAHKLGVSTQPKVYARNLKPEICGSDEAKTFFNENHIQGWVSSSHYLCLKDETNTILAAASFKKVSKVLKNDYYLTRYATSRIVVGGFTKLLKFFEHNFEPHKIITFSDNCVSDGGLYQNNGFVEDIFLKPDYYYFSSRTKNKEHKFLYRLHRFKTDPTLSFVEGLTENQLAEINKLSKIWDAGKTRWVKNFS